MSPDTKPKLIVTRVPRECDYCGAVIPAGTEVVRRYKPSNPSPSQRWLSPAGYEYFELACWDKERAWMWKGLTVEKMRSGT